MVKTQEIKTVHCDKCGAEITDGKNRWFNRITLGMGYLGNQEVSISIENLSTPGCKNIRHPDLCKDCVCKILKKLSESIQ